MEDKKKEKSNNSVLNDFNVLLEKMDDLEFYKMYSKKNKNKGGKK